MHFFFAIHPTRLVLSQYFPRSVSPRRADLSPAASAHESEKDAEGAERAEGARTDRRARELVAITLALAPGGRTDDTRQQPGHRRELETLKGWELGQLEALQGEREGVRGWCIFRCFFSVPKDR